MLFFRSRGRFREIGRNVFFCLSFESVHFLALLDHHLPEADHLHFQGRGSEELLAGRVVDLWSRPALQVRVRKCAIDSETVADFPPAEFGVYDICWAEKPCQFYMDIDAAWQSEEFEHELARASVDFVQSYCQFSGVSGSIAFAVLNSSSVQKKHSLHIHIASITFRDNKQIKPHLRNYFLANPGCKIEQWVDYAVYSHDRLFRLPYYAKSDKPDCPLIPIKSDQQYDQT